MAAVAQVSVGGGALGAAAAPAGASMPAFEDNLWAQQERLQGRTGQKQGLGCAHRVHVPAWSAGRRMCPKSQREGVGAREGGVGAALLPERGPCGRRRWDSKQALGRTIRCAEP